MKKILLAVCLLALVFLGWAYERGQKIAKDETCRQIRYRLDCGRTWQKYRLDPSLDNKPLCDTGELSIGEFVELTNRAIELDCPSR